MKISKKTVVWSSILAVLGVTALWLNKQIKKIQDFTLTFKKVTVNKFNINTLDFNVYYDYTNKSDVNINLSSQEYDVYINDVFIKTLTNYSENVLKANSISSLGFNVSLELKELDKKLNTNYYKMITEPKSVKIKVVMKWKVRMGIFKIPVRYTWETTLKEILSWFIPAFKK